MRALALFLIFVLAGCTGQPGSPLAVTPAAGLTPYQTRTAQAIASASLPASPSPAPSATPFIYTISTGDTFSALARRFDVSLDALQAANPGLQPGGLSVGQKVNIPAAGQQFGAVPQTTPASLEPDQAVCRVAGGGTLCLAAVHNPYPHALENVKFLITMFDEDGKALGSQEAPLPLDILLPGQTLPAAAFFPDILGAAGARLDLLTAVQVEPQDGRYLKANINNLLVTIAWDGLSASLRGQVSLEQGSLAAGRLWLAAVAYDAAGQVTGYRRWEAHGGLPAGAVLPFEMSVYGLGGSIERVELLVEAAR